MQDDSNAKLCECGCGRHVHHIDFNTENRLVDQTGLDRDEALRIVLKEAAA